MLREGGVVGVTDAIDALGGSMRDARASAAPVAVAPASASTSAVERMPLLGAGRTRAAAADSAASGVRARGVAPSLRAALVACATLAVAAVVGVSLGASRASPVGRGDVAFASLGAAGKKLGSGVRAERAGSATEVPGKPTPLEAFNPFADARGLKLDPRKLPPLTPAGLAKSQRATMMVDQVNAQWLRSSADAAREDGETHDSLDGEISGAAETAEGAARVPGSSRGGGAASAERMYDDDGAYDARDDDAYYDDARAEVSRRRRRRAFRRSRSAVPPRDRYDSEDVDGRYHREPTDGYHREPADGYHREPTDGYREPARRRSSPGAAGGGVILGGGRGGGGGGGGGGGFAARRKDWLDDRHGDGREYDEYDDGREYDGFDVPSPRGRDGGGFKTRERERLLPRARAPFSFDPDPEATARSRSRSAAVGITSRSFAGARACVLKRGVTDAQAQAVLDYACDPARRDAVRGFSCAAIKKGGAAFIPNTKRDHASWAVSHFFQARLRERDAFPQQDCHFSGVATLDAFPGNFYLTADGGLRSANDALDALVTRTPVNEGGVVFDTVEPFGGSLVDRVTGAWSETLAVPTTLGETNRLGSAPLDGDVSERRLKRRRDGPATTFKFWAGAAPGTGGGCMVETSVSYDFDGDGTMDRVEHFQPQGVPEEPDLIPVESAVLGGDARVEGDAYWTGVTNARARLSVRSPNCPGAVRVWESAEMYPSFLTVPYDAE